MLLIGHFKKLQKVNSPLIHASIPTKQYVSKLFCGVKRRRGVLWCSSLVGVQMFAGQVHFRIS